MKTITRSCNTKIKNCYLHISILLMLICALVTGTQAQVTTLAAVGSSPNANGATISGNTLNLEPASASYGGVLNAIAQSIKGDKTFVDDVYIGGFGTIANTSPRKLSMGASYSSVAGSNLKFRLYDDNNAANNYGIGISASQMDYAVPFGASHSMYVAGTKRLNVNSTGLQVTGTYVQTDGSATIKMGDYLGGTVPGIWFNKATPSNLNFALIDDNVGNTVLNATGGVNLRVGNNSTNQVAYNSSLNFVVGEASGVTGNAKLHLKGTFYNSDAFLNAGGGLFRLEGTGNTVPTGSTGKGIEIFTAGGISYISAADRTGAPVYSPLSFYGSTLAFNGTSTFANNATFNGNITSGVLDTDLTPPVTSGTTKMVITDANGQLSFANFTGVNTWAVSGNNMYSTNSGNVGIGITTPHADAKLDVTGRVYVSDKIAIGTKDQTQIGTYALAVNGDAIFKKVKVKLYGQWADFVFDEHYDLATLAEVDQFIKIHHHLPGVPSAKEVVANGIDLEETQTVLLQKVEELTLYIIAMDKEIKELKKQVGNSKRTME